jgi:hypothetical protein
MRPIGLEAMAASLSSVPVASGPGAVPAGRLHPAATTRHIHTAGGLDFDAAAKVPLTQPPSPAELALLRGLVCDRMPETTPELCVRLPGRAGLAQPAAA